ncbi:hypothetical protein QBC40DRAFT_295563 [Triangularia verruculosa]|uniref:Uncharacterized protein n=1 Tax=Triangularia verruculosa TaxID=2587418 RepID=A0AAN6XJL8_9PEZI|nr:hypothetical protein QBC40DRAFT_295563 [Triangularia verruculosa]
MASPVSKQELFYDEVAAMISQAVDRRSQELETEISFHVDRTIPLVTPFHEMLQQAKDGIDSQIRDCRRNIMEDHQTLSHLHAGQAVVLKLNAVAPTQEELHELITSRGGLFNVCGSTPQNPIVLATEQSGVQTPAQAPRAEQTARVPAFCQKFGVTSSGSISVGVNQVDVLRRCSPEGGVIDLWDLLLSIETTTELSHRYTLSVSVMANRPSSTAAIEERVTSLLERQLDKELSAALSRCTRAATHSLTESIFLAVFDHVRREALRYQAESRNIISLSQFETLPVRDDLSLTDIMVRILTGVAQELGMSEALQLYGERFYRASLLGDGGASGPRHDEDEMSIIVLTSDDEQEAVAGSHKERQGSDSSEGQKEKTDDDDASYHDDEAQVQEDSQDSVASRLVAFVAQRGRGAWKGRRGRPPGSGKKSTGRAGRPSSARVEKPARAVGRASRKKGKSREDCGVGRDEDDIVTVEESFIQAVINKHPKPTQRMNSLSQMSGARSPGTSGYLSTEPITPKAVGAGPELRSTFDTDPRNESSPFL